MIFENGPGRQAMEKMEFESEFISVSDASNDDDLAFYYSLDEESLCGKVVCRTSDKDSLRGTKFCSGSDEESPCGTGFHIE